MATTNIVIRTQRIDSQPPMLSPTSIASTVQPGPQTTPPTTTTTHTQTATLSANWWDLTGTSYPSPQSERRRMPMLATPQGQSHQKPREEEGPAQSGGSKRCSPGRGKGRCRDRAQARCRPALRRADIVAQPEPTYGGLTRRTRAAVQPVSTRSNSGKPSARQPGTR